MTTPVYTTLDDVKALFPANAIGTASRFGTSYDTLISSMIVTASREVDGFLKRRPGAFAIDANATQYFDGSGTLQQWIGELAAVPSVVSVAEGGDTDNRDGTGGTYTTYGANDFVCWPYNALSLGMPFTRLDIDVRNGTKSTWYKYPRAVKVVGAFGFATSTTKPEEIVKATTIQAMRYFKRAQQAFADVGAIAELGQLRYVKELDPDVKNILSMAKFAVPWI